MRNGYEEGKFKEGIVMKANAPEKIYLQEPTKVRTEKKYDNDVEYIRTDAFVEKACSWLKNHYRDYMHNPTGNRLEAFFGGDMCNDFKNYMKGE
jgi:hypothetical protein